jgi:glucokinase
VTDACLAVDIGGTKLAAGVVTSDGLLFGRRQVATPRNDGAEAIFTVLTELASQVRNASAVEVTSIGVGCGGPMEPGGILVSPLNIPGWRYFPLVDRLEATFGLPAFVDNDAKALALAEGWLGSAIGNSSYLAMVVSTGVGGGIVLDGRLLDGSRSNAGHIGHIVVEPGGRLCGCGVRGCLEAEASGTAIAAMTGRPAAEAGIDVIERCGEMVGRAVASVVTLLDLNLCVVAGSVALGYGEPFFEAANRSLAERVGLDFTAGAKIVPAGLGADGPLLGAARVGFLGAEQQGDST